MMRGKMRAAPATLGLAALAACGGGTGANAAGTGGADNDVTPAF